jgi:hypothetical protein
MQLTATNQGAFVLGGGLLAVIAFHVGVLNGIEGLGLALFFLVVLAVLEAAIVLLGLRTNTWARVFLIPFSFCVLNAAFYSHEMTRVVSILVGYASFTLYAYWSTTARVAWQQVAKLAPSSYVLETVLPAAETKTPFVFWKSHASTAARIGLGLAFALPILLFLGILFADADPVFQRVMSAIFPTIENVDAFIGKIIVDVVFVTIFARGVWLVLTRQSEGRTAHDAAPSTMNGSAVHADISTTILAAMSIFVAVFVAIQVRVMIGGEAWMRSMDLTYAEYARSGYGQMVVACGLIGAVLLALYALRALSSRAARWLSYVLVVESVLILLSAWARLQRYVDAYSLTVDRLWGQVFIIGLGLGAAWLVWSLVRGYALGRFSTVLVIGAMTYFVSVPCVLNIEGQVVSTNVFTREASKLDFNYFSGLSSDGLRVLDSWEQYYAYYNPEARRIVQDGVAALRERKQTPLSLTLNDYRLIWELERRAANLER